MKNVAVLTEDGVFALFFRPYPGAFDSSRVPTPGNLPSKAQKKMLMLGGQPEEGRGALGAAGIDWCIGANCYAIWSMADAVFPHQMKQCQTLLDIASQTKWF